MSHRKGIQKLEADRGKGELRLQKKEEVTMKQKEEKKKQMICVNTDEKFRRERKL